LTDSNLSDSARKPLLSVEISVDYPGKEGVLSSAALEVFPNETVGLVGQSGSGKTTLAMAILRLLDQAGARARGRINLLDQDLTHMSERQLRTVRGRLVALIPQSPANALNPVLRIGTQFREAWRAHSSQPFSAQQTRVQQLFETVGLEASENFLKRFPNELSVGQAQRVLLVMALLHFPPLLIADEPTSALDVITQQEVLDLLVRTAKQQRMSTLFISHDLAAMARVCDRVAILHEGRIVESGPVSEVLRRPSHPFTKRLVAAILKGK
jgi:ABC-type glutathione transport system ATPase component